MTIAQVSEPNYHTVDDLLPKYQTSQSSPFKIDTQT
jgi:hypothetical protein